MKRPKHELVPNPALIAFDHVILEFWKTDKVFHFCCRLSVGRGVNTKEIEIEIKGNEAEINWQRDYLQAIWWSLAQTLPRYFDIHNHYAQKEDKRT